MQHDIHEYEVLTGPVTPYLDIDCKDMTIDIIDLLSSIIWTFAQDDKQFWDNIYDVLMKPESGAIIGKYLAQIDISAFNPRKALLTEYAKIALTEAKSSEICFIESNAWNGEEINTSDLYVIYKNFCVNHHLQYAKSTKSFGMKLMGLVRDGLIFKGRNAESRTYTKKTIGDTPP